MRNARTITLSSVFMELFPLLIFAVLNLPGAISESIKENQMKLDTLGEGHQRYCRMQEL